MFGQTFEPHDLAVIALLVILEGVLSIDNAMVLGLLAQKLPKHERGKALTYGLIGAFVFRLIATVFATYLFRWRIIKVIGGAYLVYVAGKHFFAEWRHGRGSAKGNDGKAAAAAVDGKRTEPSFWGTVAAVELTDVAFAVDSILAAVALVGSAPPGTPADAVHPKLWVIITGGMIGVLMMRAAAALFIGLLKKYPRFETSAYLLVAVIGVKLVVDWLANHDPEHPAADFHSPSSVAFWVFWVSMAVCMAVGFIPSKHRGKYDDPAAMGNAGH